MPKVRPYEVNTLLDAIKRLPPADSYDSGQIVGIPLWDEEDLIIGSTKPCNKMMHLHYFKCIIHDKGGHLSKSWLLLV